MGLVEGPVDLEELIASTGVHLGWPV